MASSNPTGLLEWLPLLVKGVVQQHAHVFVLSEKFTENIYSAILLAPLRLDDHRTGLRKFVVTGIDTEGEPLEPEQIPTDLELLSAELGVISGCLLCNAERIEATRERLRSLNVLYIQIQGGGYSTPDSHVCAQFGHVLLGELAVRESIEVLSQVSKQSNESIEGEDALATLRNVLKATLLFCLSEEIVWSPTTANRENVLQTGSGELAELSFHYGVKRYPAFEGCLEYCFPNGATLIARQREALSLYAVLFAINVSDELQKTVILLQKLTRELVDYVNSWLSGTTATVGGKDIQNLVDELRQLPEPAVLGATLADAAPLEQLELLSFFRAGKLRSTGPAVLSLLERASPKVQEACIYTLISLDTLPEMSVIAPYAESPRSGVAHSAVRALAAIATEEAAEHLVMLMQTGKLDLNETTIFALARTHTVAAFGPILNLCATSRGNVPPIALEECIDYLLPLVEAGQVVFDPDKEWIQRIATEMYEREDFPVLCQRLALKTVRLFHLENAQDLLHKGLCDKSLRTRISAMKCAATFPSEGNAEAILRSANEPIDDYEGSPLTEWVMAEMEVRSKRDGPAGYIASQGDLDLASVAVAAFKQMGDEYYDRYAPKVIHSSSLNTQPDAEKENLKSEASEPKPLSVAKRELVYVLPKQGHVWVSLADEDGEAEKDDVFAIAVIVHNNKFESTPSTPTAAAMLGGGSISTMGSRKEIMEDVVWRCLRGEEPVLPTSAGMGETVTKNL